MYVYMNLKNHVLLSFLLPAAPQPDLPDLQPVGQGRRENLKRWEGETDGGEGRILRKINCFCEILNKMSQKEGGGAKDRRPPNSVRL